MVILRDRIRFYEGAPWSQLSRDVWWSNDVCVKVLVVSAGQKLLDSLAETWDFFFCDVLPMLQAIFHPVQVRLRLRGFGSSGSAWRG